MNDDRKWGFCPCCHKWRQAAAMICNACGNPLSLGKIPLQENQADPRVQGPVASRERKPL